MGPSLFLDALIMVGLAICLLAIGTYAVISQVSVCGLPANTACFATLELMFTLLFMFAYRVMNDEDEVE